MTLRRAAETILRFDDSLATVLAAETTTSVGVQASWRQLVDLAGRGRVPDLDDIVARLRGLRGSVPPLVRAASARALASFSPPFPLVALFAEDDVAVAAPVLRTAVLDADAWLALLPRLSLAARAILRHRRDLPGAAQRGLALSGSAGLVLADERPAFAPEPTIEAPPPANETTQAPVAAVVMHEVAQTPAEAATQEAGELPQSQIADLIARIDASRPYRPAAQADARAPFADRWRFETDTAGVIRWVEGVARGPLIGLSLTQGARDGTRWSDSVARDAFRARAPFDGARLNVGGASTAAGRWRLSGAPRYDRTTGQFRAMTGIARRLRREAGNMSAPSLSDSLRQLTHELRTPATAIAGYAELIDAAPLGPIPRVYRCRARTIRRRAGALVAAIDDLDTTARLQSNALVLRPERLDLAPLVRRIVAEFGPRVTERGMALTVDAGSPALVEADGRGVATIIDRLIAVVLAAATPGEALRARLVSKTRTVRLHLTRPRALQPGTDGAYPASIAPEASEGGPLLGIDFTFRLMRDLAAALGGSLAITPDRLTLRLPVAT